LTRVSDRSVPHHFPPDALEPTEAREWGRLGPSIIAPGTDVAKRGRPSCCGRALFPCAISMSLQTVNLRKAHVGGRVARTRNSSGRRGRRRTVGWARRLSRCRRRTSGPAPIGSSTCVPRRRGPGVGVRLSPAIELEAPSQPSSCGRAALTSSSSGPPGADVRLRRFTVGEDIEIAMKRAFFRSMMGGPRLATVRPRSYDGWASRPTPVPRSVRGASGGKWCGDRAIGNAPSKGFSPGEAPCGARHESGDVCLLMWRSVFIPPPSSCPLSACSHRRARKAGTSGGAPLCGVQVRLCRASSVLVSERRLCLRRCCSCRAPVGASAVAAAPRLGPSRSRRSGQTRRGSCRATDDWLLGWRPRTRILLWPVCRRTAGDGGERRPRSQYPLTCRSMLRAGAPPPGLGCRALTEVRLGVDVAVAPGVEVGAGPQAVAEGLDVAPDRPGADLPLPGQGGGVGELAGPDRL